MQTILFVCTGNTCRSVMAEAILKHMLRDREDRLRDIKIMSAGIHAWEGGRASPGAMEVLSERGIDAVGHSSALLTPELVEEADLVLTMTSNHKRIVLHMCPAAGEKVYTLREYVLDNGDKKSYAPDAGYIKGDHDISDPYGRSVEIYRESAEEIEKYLGMLIDKISSKL